MTVLLCRNKVQDYDRWKTVFDSHESSQSEAGLHLLYMWCDVADPNDVYFVFDVSSEEKARSFLNDADSARAAKIAGVIDEEAHFLEDPEARG